MEAGLSLLNVPVGAVSRDVSPDLYCNEVMTSSATSGDVSRQPSPMSHDDGSPDLYCNEVMTASPKPSLINERSWCVKSDYPFFLNDVPRKEKLCDESHWDCASCPVRRAGAHFKQLHGRYLNGVNEITGRGPFQLHNRGTTGGVTCFFCLTQYERDMPFCSCMAPIQLGDPGRPLRRIVRQDFFGPYVLSAGPYLLSDGAGPFRYVGAGPRYEKEPQHRTRPGDKDGEGGDAWRAPRYDTYMADFFAQLQDAVGEDGEGGTASSTKVMPDKRACGSEGPVGEPWRWEQLYLEYEVGKACRCVCKWCEYDYSRRADGNEGPVGKRHKT